MPEVHNKDPFNDFKREIEENSKDHTSEFDPQDIKANSGLAAACYISILFFLPLVLRPDSKFARFHANQGLILLIVGVALGAAKGVTLGVPIVTDIFGALLGLIQFGYFLYGFVNTLNGKAKELPFIGGITLIR